MLRPKPKVFTRTKTPNHTCLRRLHKKLLTVISLLTLAAVLSASAPAQRNAQAQTSLNAAMTRQPIIAAGIFDFFRLFFQQAGNTIVVDDDGLASAADCDDATTAASTTIQGAVTSAMTGDIIKVCPGSYPESVNVSTSLTINGPQANIDAKTRTGLPEAVVGGNQTIAFNVTGTPTVTINGFTISTTAATDDNPAVFLQSGSGHIISNNIFTSSVRRASYFSSPNTTFQNNRVSSVFDGFFGGVDNTTIQDNLFDGSYPDGAINTTISSNDSKSDNFKILSNTFTTNSGNIGVLFATQDSIISGNTINNTGDSSSFFVGGGNDNLTIRDNTFTATVFSAVAVTDGGFTYINPNIQYGNNSNISFINNTINRVITNDSNNFTTIDYRGVAGANRILNNSVTLTRATGANSGTSGYGIRLRGSASGTFNITGNLLDGNSIQSIGTPSTSGLVISSNQPASNPVGNGGQFPVTSIVNANCNSFSNNQNGVAVYDFVNSTSGGLQTDSDININNNNFINNSPFDIDNGGTSETIDATNNFFDGGAEVSNNVNAASPLTAATQCASVINAPMTATVDQMSTLTFSNISVNDPDIDTMPLTVVLSVTNGTLTLTPTTGVTITNNNTSNVTLVGTIENVNTALSSLVYDPANTFSGSDTLNITSSSMGSPGAGSGLTQASSAAVAISVTDSTAPTVSSITRATGGTNPTMATSVNFTVIFSEPVKGVDVTDFTVAKTGNLSDGTVSNVTPEMADANGFTSIYTVTVSGFSAMNGNGTIGLNVIDDNTIIDVANIPLDGGFTGGETYTILMNAPANCDNDAPQRVYNVATEFSLGGNPNCEYTYGNTVSPSSNTVLTYQNPIVGAFNTPGIDGWYGASFNSDGFPIPGIFKNNNTTQTTYLTIVQPAGTLALHPGKNGERSVLRFTVPTGGAGLYNINGRFTGIDNGGGNNAGTTTDVSILVNGVSVFSGDITSFNDAEPFSFPRNLAVGDTVDFSVGYGANATYSNDSTGLAATLTPVNVAGETLYGLTNETTQRLVSFSSTDPGNTTDIGAITIPNASAGERIVGIDFRPRNRVLYGISRDSAGTGRVYTIDATSGTATAVSTNNTIRSASGSLTLNGAEFGVDFNPAADRIRVISDSGQNLRINPDTGLTVVDGTLNPVDTNGTTRTGVTGAAYTNSDFDPNTGTTLYDIDTVNDTLVIQNPPNNGTLASVGALGFDATSVNGFDISSVVNANTAYASFQSGTSGELYTINLTTGAATPIGTIGGGGTAPGLSIRGLTAAPIDGVGNDGTFPTATITRADTNPTMASTVNFTVTFSEAVTNVDAGDFSVATTGTTGTPTITVTPTTATPTTAPVYNVAVTGYTGDGTVGLNLVDNDTIVDGSNNQLGGSGFNPANLSGDGSVTGPVYTVNQNVPYVTSITRLDPDPTNASSVRFQVNFSEAVTGVDSADFRFTTTGSVNGVGIPTNGISGSGTTYIVTVSIGTATSGSTLRLDVFDNDTIIDANGAPLGTSTGAGDGSFMTGQFYTIDKTAPTVAISPATTSSTSTSPVNFTVVFSETVMGFIASDVTVATGTGTAFSTGTTPTIVVTPASGSGTTFNVAVSGMNQSGAVTATIPVGAASDPAGNSNSNSASSTITFTLVNTPITVNPTNTGPAPPAPGTINRWWGFNDVTDTYTAPMYVVGPGTPATVPSGIGSASLNIGATDKLLISSTFFNGTPLNQITELSYSTYGFDANNSQNLPSLQIGIDYDSADGNNGGFQGRLVFDPADNQTAPNQAPARNTWQRWNATNGRFYFSRAPGNANCGIGSPCTLATILAMYPRINIPNTVNGFIGFRSTGGGTSPVQNYVDRFTIGVNSGNTTFDFEPAPPTVSIDDAATPLAQNEGNSGPTAYSFVVRLSEAAMVPVTVRVQTTDGTATTADNDYGAVSTDLTFNPGDPLFQTVTVNVNGDTKFESSESFTLNLSNPINTAIASGAGSRTGTITNDDTAPTVSISNANPAAVTEGNTGSTTTSAFTVSLSNASDTAVTVSVTPGGTATSGTDFTLDQTTVTFAPGETTKTVTATIIGDTIDEADETFTATVAVTSGSATVATGMGTGTGTITDDDALPVFTIDSVMQAEGNSGTSSFVFTVTKTGATEQTSTVSFATADGTATIAGNDYQSNSDSLTFTPSQITQTITVLVNGDILVEPNETFTVVLSAPTNATIANGTGTGTITNDDANPTVTITPTATTTSTSPVNFTVTFSRSVSGFTASDVIVGGTAFSTGTTPTVVVTPASVNVAVYNVAVSGMNQNGTVTISVPAGAAIDSAGNPNDASTVDGSVNFVLNANTVTVNPTNTLTPGITAWGGFDDNTNQVTVPAYNEGPAITPLGTGSARLNTSATGKFLFFSNYFNSTSALPLSQITELSYGAYANDPTNQANLPSLQIGIDYDSTDTNNGFQGRLVFIPADNQTAPNQAIVPQTWQRWNASNGRFFATQAPGNAVCPQSNPCSLATILATYPNINIPNNAFGFIGFRSTGGETNAVENYVDAFTIGVNSANTTFNFEAQPPTISVGDATISEGNSGTTTATFTVAKSVASQLATTVVVNTTDDTATVADGDYVAVTNQTVTIPANALSADFTVTINGDMKFEPTETFTVNLSNAVNAAIADGSGTGTITNNDAQPTLSIARTTDGAEPSTANVFTVTLSGQTSSQVTVQYATANVTATAGSDYTSTSSTLTFAANTTTLTQTITVATLDDLVFEGTENFTVLLSNPTNATITGTNPATGVITDNENQPTVQFTPAAYTVSDSTGSNAVITVTLSGASATPVTVNYATSNGTATGGNACSTSTLIDYVNVSGTLTFLANTTTAQTFNVPVCGDTRLEGNETVNLMLSAPSGATVSGTNPGTLTITDGANNGNLMISGTITPATGTTGTVNPNVTVTLSADGIGMLTTTTDANGNYTFSGLQGGITYLVTPSKFDFVFDPINRSVPLIASSVAGVNFTAYNNVGQVGRNLRVVTTSKTPGSNTVTVPITLDSLGNENSLSFSLNYDSTLLSNPVAACGSDAPNCSLTVNTTTTPNAVGIAFTRADDVNGDPTVFTAGNGRQAITVTFTTNPMGTATFNTPITFSSTPTRQNVSDADGNSLLTNYINGFVLQGLEGDIIAPNTGNGLVETNDLTRLRQFVAGTAQPDSTVNQFQRSDVAPAGSKGDGFLDSSDITVLRRFIQGTLPLTSAGGPSQAASTSNPLASLAKISSKGNTVSDMSAAAGDVRIVSVSASPNTTVMVPIELDARGNENGLSFTLNYDQTKLSSPTVALGAGTPTAGTLLDINRTQQNAGKIGVSLSLDVNTTYSAGTKRILIVSFQVASSAPAGLTPVSFSSDVLRAFANDVNGDQVMPPANFVSGNVNILGPTAATAAVSGRVTTTSRQSVAGAKVTLTDSNGVSRSVVVNAKGVYRFDEVRTGQTYVISVSGKGFTGTEQVITVLDNLTDVNLTF